MICEHQQSRKQKEATEFLNNMKNQHTIGTIMGKQVKKRLTEANDALLKLVRITVFIVQKNWAHIKNFEDFDRFVGADLEKEILKKYLKTCQDRKKCYIFIKVINDYIKDKSLTKHRNTTDFTLMLDEAFDEGNRSHLSLIV